MTAQWKHRRTTELSVCRLIEDSRLVLLGSREYAHAITSMHLLLSFLLHSSSTPPCAKKSESGSEKLPRFARNLTVNLQPRSHSPASVSHSIILVAGHGNSEGVLDIDR